MPILLIHLINLLLLDLPDDLRPSLRLFILTCPSGIDIVNLEYQEEEYVQHPVSFMEMNMVPAADYLVAARRGRG